MYSNYRIDLHSHSSLSHDGGITKRQYVKILEKKILDCIAITDHNETKFARSLKNELGNRIIVGEEIKTLDGEIIGLFLTKTIPAGLAAGETVTKIHNDGGLVYIPHPFEQIRDSLQEDKLMEIIETVDIIEIFNGRGFMRGQPLKAMDIANAQKIAMASSSDAHCLSGINSAYNIVSEMPESKNLVELLVKGNLQKKHAPLYSLLCPGFNRIKNKLFLNTKL
jgi:predicted metal-dependent phosphoesterase TrpH